MPAFQRIDRLQLLKIFLLFLFSTLVCFNGSAQTNACPEKFRAYTSAGKVVSTFCVGETIRFKSCSATAQPDKEYYDTDKNNGLAFPDTIKSVTYSVPGTYTVTQLINTGLPGNNQFERTFTVLPTPSPELQTLGCALNKIRFTITDSNYDVYRINFGDGIERRVLPGKDTIYQYKAPGSYTVTVKAAYKQASCIIEKTFPVQTLPMITRPVLNRLEINSANNQATELIITSTNLQPEYEYIIEGTKAGSSDFQEVQRFKPTNNEYKSTVTPSDLRTPYQYRLQVTDACGTTTNIFSEKLFTQFVQILPLNKALKISWPHYPDVSVVNNYQLFRDKKLLQTLPAGSNNFLDTSVVCGRLYCYQVITVLKDNRISVSDATCQSITSTLAPKAGFITASFNNQNQVDLLLQLPSTETLQQVNWQKTTNNGALISIGKSSKPEFSDVASVNFKDKFCYQATYTDSCGKVSGLSNLSCPIILSAIYNETENKVMLNWSPYIGFTSTTNYTVEVSNEATGQILSSFPVGSGTNFSDVKLNNTAQILMYRIKASGKANEVSYSNQVSVVQPFTASIPNAFSPNNDGLNDIFEVKGQFIDNVILKIYNRWGQLIFESNTPNQGWDGTIKGREAPVGTYVFSVTAQDLNGKTISRKGSVTLVK